MAAVYTAESVTLGHPDKLCDIIADRVLDEVKKRDPAARVAVEVAAKGRKVWIFGEISADVPVVADLDFGQIARDVYAEAGYSAQWELDPATLEICVDISEQSPELRHNVETGAAGDQGSMIGYAIDLPWAGYLPPEYYLANLIARSITDARRTERIPYLGPDGKSQVTLECSDDCSLVRMINAVVSVQHQEGALARLEDDIRALIGSILLELRPKGLPESCTLAGCKLLVNPAGEFVTGGPVADAGLTGRKTVIDSYGPRVPTGGGSFSGKDGTKVDRSGAYAARWLAKSIVTSGLAAECMVQLDYSIGKVQPLNVSVWLDGDPAPEAFTREILEGFDLSPAGIIAALNLNTIRHAPQAAWGHFVLSDRPWELPRKIEVELPTSKAVHSSSK